MKIHRKSIKIHQLRVAILKFDRKFIKIHRFWWILHEFRRPSRNSPKSMKIHQNPLILMDFAWVSLTQQDSCKIHQNRWLFMDFWVLGKIWRGLRQISSICSLLEIISRNFPPLPLKPSLEIYLEAALTFREKFIFAPNLTRKFKSH